MSKLKVSEILVFYITEKPMKKIILRCKILAVFLEGKNDQTG